MADYNSRTLWCGNLSSEVTEELLYELFLQAGPVENVNIPKDVKNGRLRSFGFVTFKHECSVPYAMELMNGESLFNRHLLIQNRTASTPSGESPSSHYNSPQTPTTTTNYSHFNPIGTNGGSSPYFVPGQHIRVTHIRPLFKPQSELIVLDDDGSPQNVNPRERHRHNEADDIYLIDNDQPWQNNRQHTPNYGHSNHRHKDQYQSPALRMDSVMRNPWEQLEVVDAPNTSRHQHRQHRSWNPYENRRRY